MCYIFERKTGNIITFAHFEEGNILTKNCNDAESGDKYDNKSIMTMDSDDESDHDLISTEVLEDICDKVRPIRKLIEEKRIIKYVIILGKYNWNGKER